jgi:hypothetical protein
MAQYSPLEGEECFRRFSAFSVVVCGVVLRLVGPPPPSRRERPSRHRERVTFRSVVAQKMFSNPIRRTDDMTSFLSQPVEGMSCNHLTPHGSSLAK